MPPGWPGTPSATIRQARWCCDGRALARRYDAPRDGTRAPLLAVAPDHVGQVRLVHGVDQVGGGLAAGRVEAHVEGAVAGEGEAAVGVRELIGGEAEVQEHTVHRKQVRRGRERGEIGEVVLAGNETARRDGDDQPIGHACQRRGVGVNAEHAGIGGAALEDQRGVAAAAEGAVDVVPARPDGEGGDNGIG